MLLLLGGLDTSIGVISSFLLHLPRSKSQFELLDSRDVEEIVRTLCPVRFTMREVLSCVQYKGALFRPGERICFSWYGAMKLGVNNEQPDRLGYAFGVGEHSCLGRGLALNQLHCCVRSLKKLETWPVVLGKPEYDNNDCFFFPKQVTFTWQTGGAEVST